MPTGQNVGDRPASGNSSHPCAIVSGPQIPPEGHHRTPSIPDLRRAVRGTQLEFTLPAKH